MIKFALFLMFIIYVLVFTFVFSVALRKVYVHIAHEGLSIQVRPYHPVACLLNRFFSETEVKMLVNIYILRYFPIFPI